MDEICGLRAVNTCGYVPRFIWKETLVGIYVLECFERVKS